MRAEEDSSYYDSCYEKKEDSRVSSDCLDEDEAEQKSGKVPNLYTSVPQWKHHSFIEIHRKNLI